MDALFDAGAGLPASFAGNPFFYLLTTFSLLCVNLLILEWLWRIVWSIAEHPQPIKCPTTTVRLCIGLLLIGALFRTGPDTILLIAWEEMDYDQRLTAAIWGNILDIASFVPLIASWLIFYIAGPLIIYQLERHPIPVHVWPTWEQLRRPAKIGLGVLALCSAFTFLRH